MSKIATIRIENFKAVSEFSADFKGCTAIITAGNNKGKTSFLRGIPDRVRFIRPEVMVKEGSTKGSGEMTLTDGTKFIWDFSDKKDSLQIVSKDGIKANVTKEIGAKYFPPTFDIDKFLQSTPKKQAEQLQQIIGIDFTDIDTRYASAYADRTEKNKAAENYQAKLTSMIACPAVDHVDLTDLQLKKDKIRANLNAKYLENKAENENRRSAYERARTEIITQVNEFNALQSANQNKYTEAGKLLTSLVALGYNGSDVELWLELIKRDILPYKIAADLFPAEPTYIEDRPDDKELIAIDAQILSASETNQKATEYNNYIQYKQTVEAAKVEAKEADEKVKAIEAERAALIASAKFPQGLAITPDGITVDGLPLDRNQISTSKLYCAALRIASMNLGEVKTLYFDASFLDKNSLAEIEQWGASNDLQLLIERPDFDGGEITYQLIES